MPSRVERYEEKGSRVSKRTVKNQELYQDIKDYSDYKEITSIEPVIVKSAEDIKLKEEELRRKKESYKSEEVLPTERLSTFFQMNENKEYDINKVLKTAKKERVVVDEMEEKRKLKRNEYNIVEELGLEKIEEIDKKRQHPVLGTEDRNELKELIDTIYSNTLAQEVNEKNEEELFSDLMPTKEENTVISEELSKQMIEEEKKALKVEQKKEEFDSSFFTESNNLVKSDFVSSEDDDDDFLEEEETPKWVIIPIILAVLIVVGVIGYLLYKGV